MKSWFGRKSAAPSARAFVPSWLQSEGAEGGFARSYSERVREVFECNPVGQRAVRLVAGMLGGLTIDGPDRAVALVTAGGLLESVAANLLLHDNAYVQLIADGRDVPAELVSLRPERVQLVCDERGWPVAYLYRAAGQAVRIERSDGLGRMQVAHLKALHPRDDHYGMGCVEAAIAAASVHNRASRWNKALLDNANSVANSYFNRLRDPVGEINYYAGHRLIAPNGVSLGSTRIGGIATGCQMGLHNSGPSAAGVPSTLTFEQGFEADGTTPRGIARIAGWASTASPATAEGIIYFGTRTYTGGGTYTDWLQLNGPGLFWGPVNAGQMESGAAAARWKKGWFDAIDAKDTILSSGGAIGYAAGAGGAVTQAGSKSSAVTINKPSGRITSAAEALAGGAVVSFTVNNSQVAASDAISLSLAAGSAVAGAYRYWVDLLAAGSFRIAIENRSGSTLAEALVFNFAVLKAAGS